MAIAIAIHWDLNALPVANPLAVPIAADAVAVDQLQHSAHAPAVSVLLGMLAPVAATAAIVVAAPYSQIGRPSYVVVLSVVTEFGAVHLIEVVHSYSIGRRPHSDSNGPELHQRYVPACYHHNPEIERSIQ